MRVAIIHDWLLGMRGGEHCLETLTAMYPEAEIYTLFHRADNVSPSFKNQKIQRSVLGELPFVEKYYRHLLPIYYLGVRSLEKKLLKQHKRKPYDAVISVNHCVAKNVRLPKNVPHLCYCLTPVRYAWDQFDMYFAKHRFRNSIAQVMKRIRAWDQKCASDVDTFVGISEFVVDRINRYYKRDATVIYPPVKTDWLLPRKSIAADNSPFLVVSALVPYKNVELIVRAFNDLPYQLIIVGEGPLSGRLRKTARDNIKFRGFVDARELAELYRSSRALVFAAEEDFGMTPVEMQATGGPVIAFGKGGVLETVVASGENKTGVFFQELSAESLCSAVEEFISRQEEFTIDNCLKQARKFSLERFVTQFEETISGMNGQEKLSRHA